MTFGEIDEPIERRMTKYTAQDFAPVVQLKQASHLYMQSREGVGKYTASAEKRDGTGANEACSVYPPGT